MREHTLRWPCASKSHAKFVGQSKAEYLDHMNTFYRGKYTENQLNNVANRNARATHPMFTSCPLCGLEMADSSVESHIVGHLRLLALKSLPITEEEDKNITSSEDSESAQTSDAGGSRAQTRTTTKEETSYEWEPPEFINFEEIFDPSAEFIQDEWFDGIGIAERLSYEWGFVLGKYELSQIHQGDPILSAIKDMQQNSAPAQKSCSGNSPSVYSSVEAKDVFGQGIQEEVVATPREISIRTDCDLIQHHHLPSAEPQLPNAIQRSVAAKFRRTRTEQLRPF